MIDLSASEGDNSGVLDYLVEDLRIMFIMKGASESDFFLLDDSFASNFFSDSFARPQMFPVNESIFLS